MNVFQDQPQIQIIIVLICGHRRTSADCLLSMGFY
ncbi:hypothetical protein SAJA_08040 [Salinisphaera japonica YTM-1]|uniref:Uncharacterized protein n=1 Tax=Salinisphaera japonica YTM-1 TaxID=1209778 RepID=A0A423PS44_9GAMM|nr:hypothetical protein SAJA_08040 [Salinisphaera japonica YTM-1]